MGGGGKTYEVRKENLYFRCEHTALIWSGSCCETQMISAAVSWIACFIDFALHIMAANHYVKEADNVSNQDRHTITKMSSYFGRCKHHKLF